MPERLTVPELATSEDVFMIADFLCHPARSKWNFVKEEKLKRIERKYVALWCDSVPDPRAGILSEIDAREGGQRTKYCGVRSAKLVIRQEPFVFSLLVDRRKAPVPLTEFDRHIIGEFTEFVDQTGEQRPWFEDLDRAKAKQFYEEITSSISRHGL